MPQLSRRTFNVANRYETVVFQEGTHPADFEMVELQDIQNNEREAFIEALLTDGAIGTAFKATGGTGAGNSVFIGVGPAYVGGLRLLMPDSIHQLVAGQYIYNMSIATPAVARVDLVYLDIFVDDVTSAMDPNIEDPTLGPGAYRERVRYTISVSENVTSATPPTLPIGHTAMPVCLVTRRAGDPSINVADVTDVRPIASFTSQFKPQNVLIVAQDGGDFNNPYLALSSITSSSAANPWTILVMPGVYTITSPLLFSQPYVSMVGVDPLTCRIIGNLNGLSTAQIAAGNVTIKNLALDYQISSGSHAAAVFSQGAFNATLDNLILCQGAYNGGVTDSFQGIDTTAGGNYTVSNCQVYAQNTGAQAAIVAGASTTMSLRNVTVFAANCDALANNGTMMVYGSTFNATRALLVSTGNFTASQTTWLNQVLNGFAVGGANPLTLTQGVTNTMIDCVFNGLNAMGSMVDTTAIWHNVNLSIQFQTSGGGNSQYNDCIFNGGFDLNGTAANFRICQFSGAAGGWAIGGASSQALVIRGSTSPVFTGCYSSVGTCVLVLGGNPEFRACRFTSSASAAIVINVLSSSSNVIVQGCLIQLFASYSLASPIFIGGSGGSGRFTLVQTHMEGSSLGQPDYVLRGYTTGAALFAGNNSSTAGALREPTTITTFTNIAQNP